MSKKLPPTTHNLRSCNLQAGFAALLAVIIIGAAALIIALNSSLLGLGELDLGYTSQKGSEAFSVADGCAEELMRRIRINNSYQLNAASTTFDLFNDTTASCEFRITDMDGVNTRRFIVRGTRGIYTKLIRINATLAGAQLNEITITRWEEVPR